MAKATKQKTSETASEKMRRETDAKRHSQLIDTLSRQGLNIKYVIEYKDDKGNITSRWHYDLRKFFNGPILVENLDCDTQPNAKD